LGNYLQTEDKEKAHRVAKKLRSGCVYINGNAADAGTPFGGLPTIRKWERRWSLGS